MPIQFATAVVNASAAAIRDELNTFLGTAAVLEFWDGVMPMSPEASDSGNLLATVNLANPVFGTPSGSLFQTTATSPTSVTQSGTVTYFRFKDNANVCCFQGEVSDSGVVPMQVNTVTWTMGDSLQFDFLIFQVLMEGNP